MLYIRHNLSTSRDIGVLLALFLIVFPLLFKPWIHGTDPTGYYSWLRSFVIDGDLNTANEYEYFGQGDVGNTTITGYRDNPYAIGSAVLWGPFFGVAHAVTIGGKWLGGDFVADGYSNQYIIIVSLASAIYAFLSVLLTYLIGREIFPKLVVILSVITVWFASPLVFYQYSHPGMAHANDAFAYSLFLFTWYWTRTRRSVAQYGLLGLTAGLCALVRNQNAVFVIFPLLEVAFGVIQQGKPGNWQSAMGGGLLKGGVFSLAWWLAFLPQLVVWRVVFGAWFPGNPYTQSGGGTFDFLHPHLFEVLFSTNHGLFVWTPLILLAVLGWFPLWFTDRRLTMFVVSNFALQLFIVASWSSWSGSVAFGQRFFTNMAPAFALGLAAMLTVLHRYFSYRWLIAGCTVFIVWNGLLIVRYVLEDIPRLGYVPVDELVMGQFTVIPRHFSRIVQILITRE